jgi:hypothetical protein
MAGTASILLTLPLLVSPLLAAPASASPDTMPRAAGSVASKPQSRPFKGVRFFYVPSQDRYRAVKFSPRSPYHPAGFSAGAYSQGPDGVSCFVGSKQGGLYVGTLYDFASGDDRKRSYSLEDLFFGRPTSAAPASFKREARGQLNGNNVCAVW